MGRGEGAGREIGELTERRVVVGTALSVDSLPPGIRSELAGIELRLQGRVNRAYARLVRMQRAGSKRARMPRPREEVEAEKIRLRRLLRRSTSQIIALRAAIDGLRGH